MSLPEPARHPVSGHADAVNFPVEPLSPLDGSTLRVLSPGEPVPSGSIALLVDSDGTLPPASPDPYDAMITTAKAAPHPWVSIPSARLSSSLDCARSAVSAAPIAASTMCRVLRIAERLPVAEAIEVESLAYSTLLGGIEFRRWLARRPSRAGTSGPAKVRYDRTGGTVTLTLASPDTRNAMTAWMRDALHEALTACLDDPSEPTVRIRGEGRCFSTGGDLAEFGTATDLAQAHVIRTARSCAALVWRLGNRCEVIVHGACIGSGLEIAAAAARRVASGSAFFQLPELRLGLIPGAGGTATLSRAIGRHRTAWLALSSQRVPAERALEWGLVHEIRA